MNSRRTSQGKTFVVTVVVNRRIGSWPFGRVDVSSENIRVRAPAMPWVKERVVPAATVARIVCERTFSGVVMIRVEDMNRTFSDVRIEVSLLPDRLIRELERCGYQVQRRDGWQALRFPRDRVGWKDRP